MIWCPGENVYGRGRQDKNDRKLMVAEGLWLQNWFYIRVYLRFSIIKYVFLNPQVIRKRTFGCSDIRVWHFLPPNQCAAPSSETQRDLLTAERGGALRHHTWGREKRKHVPSGQRPRRSQSWWGAECSTPGPWPSGEILPANAEACWWEKNRPGKTMQCQHPWNEGAYLNVKVSMLLHKYLSIVKYKNKHGSNFRIGVSWWGAWRRGECGIYTLSVTFHLFACHSLHFLCV